MSVEDQSRRFGAVSFRRAKVELKKCLYRKEVKKMQELDEDATITQLAQAWTNMIVGKDKLQEAFYIFQEMIDKYGQTVPLLVAQASAHILQGRHDAAEECLQVNLSKIITKRAFFQDALQRDANDAEALVNMIVVTQALQRPDEETQRYVNLMRETHPHHPWTLDYNAKEATLTRLCETNA